ncbi:UDP-N-acetylmuramoyl-tripeptide--D-alanyl-D-alanine ligase [Qipengyuania atrilutea]|uniref:UDP-N-acetylmuramoyl-tripeptide--D-alanyl-D-alanine ligase n=1 Tax=Qipengyuania atrilutea TaxID=2744473 RepID=A0A850H1Q5_9SPHN|nr:UDP-N-acetylmuramoyl-tripeptide--D-alanyl-D-alanine ligase [Actirhodobacter atriluteus]NVD45891.1 UDP-N-acetylmuramoyl-tripeptide--D-alanyl-D-alanine ligase [Actirhodobacter atriluteus]
MIAYEALREWPADPRRELPLALWTSMAIAEATGGSASTEFEVAGVETDSRYVREGDLFVALKGEAMDGHRFIDKAFENGAIAALTDREVPYPHIRVADTSEALAALGRAARERAQAKFIGVTGSVGKTGVKEAIFAALERSSRGAAHRSIKSYNNHVGVPLSLARMPARSRFGVFEMGMNHAGEIAGLTRHVRPDVAVITTIAPAHIENLGSEEAIADAKAEIFEGVKAGGTAVIPADSPHFERLKVAAEKQGCKIMSFGRAAHADMRVLDVIPSANGGSLMTAQFGNGRLVYTVAEPGEHWVLNSLAVMAAVLAAGGDLAAAGIALAEMGGLAGRGARHRIAAPGGKALVIDESYNANPASMRATLGQLGQTPASRRIAVLGSMKELGDFAPRFHAGLAGPLSEAKVDYAILVGEEMRSLASELRQILGKSGQDALHKVPRFVHCSNPAEALDSLADYGVVGGDAILVKGSNSIGLGKVVAELIRRDN